MNLTKSKQCFTKQELLLKKAKIKREIELQPFISLYDDEGQYDEDADEKRSVQAYHTDNLYLAIDEIDEEINELAID